jgi:PKD repeat protein
MLVLADDPDADPLTISASSLPQGATFTKVNEGVSALRWAPTAAQVGDYTVGFTVTDGNLEDTKNITITVTNDPFAIAWRSRIFGPDVRPFEIFFTADDDGDGMDNGLEYALNKDPRRSDESAIVMRVELNAADEMVTTLTYIRRTDDPDLEVEVVGSDSSRDTGPWVVQPQAPDPDQGGVPDGMQRWKAVDSVPISASHPRRFLRVRAKVGAP